MKKRAILLLLIFVFGFTLPFYSSEGAGAIAYITKEFSLDTLARMIARRLLTNLGNGVVNSINNLGVNRGQREPSFVQNWKKFLSDAQSIGTNQFRSQLGYSVQRGILCDDLKGPLSLAFQAGNVPYVDIGNPDKRAELEQGSLTPFQTKMRCTVPDNVRSEFKKDFEKGGGWDTWSRLLEPQNNLAGATLASVDELQRQRGSQLKAQENETVAGGGFQGVKGACQKAADTDTGVMNTVCYRNCLADLSDDPEYTSTNEGTDKMIRVCTDRCRGQTALGANAQCSFMGRTVTPAQILGKSAANVIDDNSKFLVTSDELSEVIVNIVSAIQNKIVNFATEKVTNALTGKEETPPPLPGGGDYIEQQAPNFLNDAEKDRDKFHETPTPTPDE
ncbi:MAG: hypothetical protein G01um101444_384 [Parcubacteria group bacterium Gr01-1014_44]|nr:MAG: hypothetical protein G01um101444_384 [Parcubacteria group bacterium Gr01-1014_44]